MYLIEAVEKSIDWVTKNPYQAEDFKYKTIRKESEDVHRLPIVESIEYIDCIAARTEALSHLAFIASKNPLSIKAWRDVVREQTSSFSDKIDLSEKEKNLELLSQSFNVKNDLCQSFFPELDDDKKYDESVLISNINRIVNAFMLCEYYKALKSTDFDWENFTEDHLSSGIYDFIENWFLTEHGLVEYGVLNSWYFNQENGEIWDFD